jgi:hypothetical protein
MLANNSDMSWPEENLYSAQTKEGLVERRERHRGGAGRGGGEGREQMGWSCVLHHTSYLPYPQPAHTSDKLPIVSGTAAISRGAFNTTV